MAKDLKIGDSVRFHGWVAPTQMASLYAAAHLILLPTTASEGWPKVLGEAMAYGVVPITSDISSIGQYLRRFELGCAVNPIEISGFLHAVKTYSCDPGKWKSESERAVMTAGHFTYDAYLPAVRELLGLSASFVRMAVE